MLEQTFEIHGAIGLFARIKNATGYKSERLFDMLDGFVYFDLDVFHAAHFSGEELRKLRCKLCLTQVCLPSDLVEV